MRSNQLHYWIALSENDIKLTFHSFSPPTPTVQSLECSRPCEIPKLTHSQEPETRQQETDLRKLRNKKNVELLFCREERTYWKMRDEEREGFVFLGKGDKVVKGKIKVSSYGEESCRGRQQCPAPERQKQVDFCQFRFESSLVWPTLQSETLSNKTTTITTKPEVFHRCDKNLCCVAVWNVRTSFSGFHEVKCLPPSTNFIYLGAM